MSKRVLSASCPPNCHPGVQSQQMRHRANHRKYRSHRRNWCVPTSITLCTPDVERRCYLPIACKATGVPKSGATTLCLSYVHVFEFQQWMLARPGGSCWRNKASNNASPCGEVAALFKREEPKLSTLGDKISEHNAEKKLQIRPDDNNNNIQAKSSSHWSCRPLSARKRSHPHSYFSSKWGRKGYQNKETCSTQITRTNRESAPVHAKDTAKAITIAQQPEAIVCRMTVGPNCKNHKQMEIERYIIVRSSISTQLRVSRTLRQVACGETYYHLRGT